MAALALGCAPEEAGSQAPREAFVDRDDDGWPEPLDCDDGDPERHPGAAERCNGFDDDCDGRDDEEPIDGVFGWIDRDGDGWGDIDSRARWCGTVARDEEYRITVGGDCDDGDARAHPGADERCDTDGDDDCDGSANDVDAVGCVPWFRDEDGDGVGIELSVCLCAAEDVWRAEVPGDCDDGDATLSTGCGLRGAADLPTDARIVGPPGAAVGLSIAAVRGPGGDRLLLAGGLPIGDDPRLLGVTGPFDGPGDLGAPSLRLTASQFTRVSATALAAGGDLDGDGLDDLAVGVYGSRPGSPPIVGSVYVLGADATGDIDLSATAARFTTAESFTTYGLTVAVAPDLDGDGLADLLVSGANGFEAWMLPGPIVGTLDVYDAAITFRDADGTLGSAVATPGDLDGDGLGDLVVSSAEGGTGGVAWVVSGGARGTLAREDALGSVVTSRRSLELGRALAGGDLDGDGRADLVASGVDVAAVRNDTGVTWLFEGPLVGVRDEDAADAQIVGLDPGDGARVLAVPGDIDDDGRDDLAIGAPGVDLGGADAGAVYLFFGPLGTERFTSQAATRLYGTSTGERAGSTLAAPGDLDGDGRPDLLVGAPGSDAGGDASGAVYLVRGGPR